MKNGAKVENSNRKSLQDPKKPEYILMGTSGIEYKILKTIGRGTFGVVYEAITSDDFTQFVNDENINTSNIDNINNNNSCINSNDIKNNNNINKFAIKKYFKSFNPNCGQLELSLLSYLNSKVNDSRILKILDGNYIEKTGDFFFVSKFFNHNEFSDFYKDMTFEKIQIYMFQLLTCLKKIHEVGIIHRDIKPDNFLFNYESNECCLIDFGLAEIDIDTGLWKEVNEKNENDEDYKILTDLQRNNYRHKLGTRGFIPPEVIFNNIYQFSSVDIWSAGVILLIILSQRLPIFNLNQFSKIESETIKDILPLIELYGKDKILEIAKINHSQLFISNIFRKYEINGGINALITKKADNQKDMKLLDLAKDLCIKLLDLNYRTRITAENALKHEFFEGIEDKIKNEY